MMPQTEGICASCSCSLLRYNVATVLNRFARENIMIKKIMTRSVFSFVGYFRIFRSVTTERPQRVRMLLSSNANCLLTNETLLS